MHFFHYLLRRTDQRKLLIVSATFKTLTTYCIDSFYIDIFAFNLAQTPKSLV